MNFENRQSTNSSGPRSRQPPEISLLSTSVVLPAAISGIVLRWLVALPVRFLEAVLLGVTLAECIDPPCPIGGPPQHLSTDQLDVLIGPAVELGGQEVGAEERRLGPLRPGDIEPPQLVIIRGPDDSAAATSDWRRVLDNGYTPWRSSYVIPYPGVSVARSQGRR